MSIEGAIIGFSAPLVITGGIAGARMSLQYIPKIARMGAVIGFVTEACISIHYYLSNVNREIMYSPGFNTIHALFLGAITAPLTFVLSVSAISSIAVLFIEPAIIPICIGAALIGSAVSELAVEENLTNTDHFDFIGDFANITDIS